MAHTRGNSEFKLPWVSLQVFQDFSSLSAPEQMYVLEKLAMNCFDGAVFCQSLAKINMHGRLKNQTFDCETGEVSIGFDIDPKASWLENAGTLRSLALLCTANYSIMRENHGDVKLALVMFK